MTDIEPDEATVWTRKMLEVYGLVNEGDPYFQDARQVLSELIASKDGEIELERGRFKIADEEVDNLRRELVAVRAEKADFLWRRRADYTVAELATLRAENERLKALSDGLRTYMYDKDAFRREWVIKKYKAAERNTAEPATDTTPEVDAPVDSGMGAEAVEQAELLWAQLPVNRKWTSIPKHEKALVCHLLSTYRTEAEARGRREALEEIKKWLRSPEGKGSDAGIDYADGFADQIERMMTGGK